MTEGPLHSYRARITAGEMDEDGAQLAVARQLDDLATALEAWRAESAPDDLFPTIALSDPFSGLIGIIFIIALISALFPSVDGAITSLTSCFCIDILGMQKSGLIKGI